MGKSNTQLLAFAKTFLGKGGSIFRSYCGLPGGTAYCNAFVTYIFHKGGDAALYCNGKKQTYCPTSIKWCRNNLAELPLYMAMPMDVMYFDWDRNGVPNHIGFVRARKDTGTIYTIEGNTNGGIVANKTRTSGYNCGIFRPHFKPTGLKKSKLTVDGAFEYQSIYMLQLALKACGYSLEADGILGKATVKALQKKAGVSADGAWGTKTSKAVQKMVGTTVDGAFGKNSVKALQTWINKKVYP